MLWGHLTSRLHFHCVFRYRTLTGSRATWHPNRVRENIRVSVEWRHQHRVPATGSCPAHHTIADGLMH